MVKVLVVRKCFDCPVKENIHMSDERQEMVCNCATCAALEKGKNKFEISVNDPIPEWCPLEDLDWYGWKLEGE